jgi:hypothetical protein
MHRRKRQRNGSKRARLAACLRRRGWQSEVEQGNISSVLAPHRRRARLRSLATQPPVDLEVAAGRATYIGSPEHKDGPSFAGQPRPRADASICDPQLLDRQADVTRWLRQAIRGGIVSEFVEGDFPRYVWHREGDVVYEARLVNAVAGEYKGYPLNADEWPTGV